MSKVVLQIVSNRACVIITHSDVVDWLEGADLKGFCIPPFERNKRLDGSHGAGRRYVSLCQSYRSTLSLVKEIQPLIIFNEAGNEAAWALTRRLVMSLVEANIMAPTSKHQASKGSMIRQVFVRSEL